jgi:hypothetical protein
MKELLQSLYFVLGRENSSDPICKAITDEEILHLVTSIAEANKIDLEDFDATKASYLQMLVLRDVYWKLALAYAPLYEISVDGLKVSKQTRFEHYFSMIQQLNKQIGELVAGNPSLGFASVKVETAVIQKDYVNANLRNLVRKTKTSITVDKQDDKYTYLEIKFKDAHITRFQVYYNPTLPVVDEYKGNTLSKGSILVQDSLDITDNKLKIPVLKGYVAVVMIAPNGTKNYKQIQVGETNGTV